MLAHSGSRSIEKGCENNAIIPPMRLAAGFVLSVLIAGAALPPFRLPDIAHPAHYELELTIIPRESAFRGVARITVEFTKRSKSLWLNAKGLNVQSAFLDVNGSRQNANATTLDEFLQLEFGGDVAPGPALVQIAFTGQLSENKNYGLYRKRSGSDWYAFTTFTPIEARRAFPCFDEPMYKAPWHLILHVPPSDVAASNTRMVTETVETDGLKRVDFDETKPIASEVVALAVGPFDVIQAGHAGLNHIPVRILAPRGRAREAGAAKLATPEILARLEKYTGIPYPWDKLDHVAVLDMPYGAVENPGLITYRDRILLAKPERDTLERQRSMRGTMAHELAHQWFGNLVTQAWWNDVWLSEGFSTWLGGKTSDLELPPFERSLAAAGSRSHVMKLDASSETRPVRLEMNSRTDMGRVYGGMVYQKGAAILNMLEQWLGPEPFQRGLQTYLREHALRTATTDDLAAALTQASGVDVGPVLHTFLDQSGFPVVRSGTECAIESGDATRWFVPVCVHGDDGASECTLLAPAQKRMTLRHCPTWIWPNRGGAGYFRVQLTSAMLEAIVKDGWEQLSTPEKLNVIDDTADLVLSHRMDAALVLTVLPQMARDSQAAVTNAAYRLLLSMMANATVEDRPKYDAAVKQMLAGGSGRR